MSESVRESTPESQSPHTEQPAGLRPKGPLTAPRATPPPLPADDQHGGELTASTPPDDTLLDTECEVITIGHAKFYLRYADWLPPLAEDEFDGLTASIREHGIQQPVVVYRLLNNHFDVVDGLHRLKVAQALELDLAQIPLNILDQATSVKEQKALAWSLNADRRHLTKEQRQARAVELRKQGLSYRAIGEQLGVSQMTARSDVQEAGVKNFTPEVTDQDEGAKEPPARIVGKDGKTYPATAPTPTESEIDIAREFIIDALRKKYSPLARGQLYRDASRIAGASGIKRKAFDAALDAMIDAGSVKEHVNPHGAREYHFADVVDRLDQRAASEATEAETPAPEPATPTVVDECARFDEHALTLAGRTDDGARDRAIEVARKLVAAGIWNGSDWIEFDAYALHDKLFGVNRVEPSDLVEGDDYWFVAAPAEGDESAGMSVEDYNRAAAEAGYASLIRADTEARVESRLAAAESEQGAAQPTNGDMDVHYSSKTSEWYTPPDILELVTRVLGTIGLDPCSNSHDAPNVPAARHFTREDDGLAQSWQTATLFMNPPYGSEIGAWVEKLAGEYEARQVRAAIALLPARTDTAWFRRLRDYPRCFVAGRLKFVSPDSGEVNPAPFPSMLVYLGPAPERFAQVFAAIGDIFVRWHVED